MSVALAYSASVPAIRRKLRGFATKGDWFPKGVRDLIDDTLGESPHESNASAWWMLFDAWIEDPEKTGTRVKCFLEDGSYVEGELGSFSREADDKHERDLFLVEPTSFRPPGGDKVEPYEATAVCISAARVVTMFVTYWQKPLVTSPAASAGAVAAGAASLASPSAAGAGPQSSGLS